MRRRVGLILVGVGVVPAVLIGILWLANRQALDPDSTAWGDMGFAVLEAAWAIPAIVLTIVGAWLVRTARP